jgi:hypothetical protein
MANPITGMNAITPPCNAKAVTPHDSTSFAFGTAKAIYVGVGGNISVEMVGDGDSTHRTVFSNVLGGTILPVQCSRVNSTSTTATTLVALY